MRLRTPRPDRGAPAVRVRSDACRWCALRASLSASPWASLSASLPQYLPAPWRRRLPTAIAVTAAMVVTLLGTLAMYSREEGVERWPDGTTHGPWLAVFDGHGWSGARGSSIVMRPRAADAPDRTHAGLIVSLAQYGDLDFRLGLRTVAQLRRPQPNPWEVAWVVWGYTDPEHFYYFTPKPNGWELGKRDPAYPGGQRFLATGRPGYPVGPRYTVRIGLRGGTVRVWVGRRLLVTHTDTERPYPRGSVGFYTEDAAVEFGSIGVSSTGA